MEQTWQAFEELVEDTCKGHAFMALHVHLNLSTSFPSAFTFGVQLFFQVRVLRVFYFTQKHQFTGALKEACFCGVLTDSIKTSCDSKLVPRGASVGVHPPISTSTLNLASQHTVCIFSAPLSKNLICLVKRSADGA